MVANGLTQLTWKGWAEVFRLFANMYFKRIALAYSLKYFYRDLYELETGGVGINLRPLERSLTSSFERVWFERFLMYLSSCALVFWRVKSLLRLLNNVYEFSASTFAMNDQLKSSKSK